MLPRIRRIFSRFRVAVVVALAFAALARPAGIAPAAAEPSYKLTPHTLVRLRVVEWVAARGEYRQWEAVEGEFRVSPEGTILLPLIGSIDAAAFDATGLAGEVARRLKAKTGLVEAPDTTIEIVDYPPIFLVGSVETPGEYAFRPGMTALQALALAGGRYRPRDEVRVQDEIRHIGELHTIRRESLRALARIARLQAEMSGAEEIKFPDEVTSGADAAAAASIIVEERAIFAARAEALTRELETLSDLRDLFAGEIDVLNDKIIGQDHQIARVEDELKGVKPLVDKGIATQSRQSDLERELARLQSDKLDQITATMRAQQNLSEASRDAQTLRGRQRTEVTRELQTAQAELEQLKVRQEFTQRLLLAAGASAARTTQAQQIQESDLVFTIVRQQDDAAVEMLAAEASLLRPGDVLKVTLNADYGEGSQQSASPIESLLTPGTFNRAPESKMASKVVPGAGAHPAAAILKRQAP
jgi:polysaccharide export outer membrane protein